MGRSADVVIFGGGVAGLWTLARLKALGYEVLLLEKAALGGVQSIASQGIIHSGLKFAIAGKVSNLAQLISAMPGKWRDALAGGGPVDLSGARALAESQILLIPKGLFSGVKAVAAQKILGRGAREIARENWPEGLRLSGFDGSAIFMDEIVLDMPAVVRALAAPYMDCIRKISEDEAADPLGFLEKSGIEARKVLFTGAGSNHAIACRYGRDKGMETQTRPLLMGMMKGAPYPLFAHLVGNGEKPVATITTHTAPDGSLVWYLGGQVAERAKEDDPGAVYAAALDAFKRYLPKVDLSQVEWAVYPVDRCEGKSKTDGWMPDTPTIHRAGDHLYCWPTKMTFAPMLGDMIVQIFEEERMMPGNLTSDWSFLPQVDFAAPPWGRCSWTKDR
ncbi:MAG: FAD-dependent oxidoreductase [Alphaproteobacteria bacterium]|nr:FAD-dependent oxidoreductase [Alphaproteobacteria bacterium]